MLCGRLADAGGAEILVDTPAQPMSVTGFLAAIAAASPALAAEFAARPVRVCADDRILSPADIVPAGAALALFPPVSGG